jgi:hypothetical protein
MQVRYEIYAKNCIAILFLYDVVTVAQFSHVVCLVVVSKSMILSFMGM